MPCSNSWKFQTGNGKRQCKGQSLLRSGRSLSSIRCALEPPPKLFDPTLIQITVLRTATMGTTGSGSSGTRTGALRLLMHLKSQDCTDSDSPEDADGLGEESRVRKKTCRPSANRGVDTSTAGLAASPSAASVVGRLTSSLQLCTSSTVRGPRHLGVARPSNFKKRSEQSPLLHQCV